MVAVVGPAVRLIDWQKATPAQDRIASTRAALFRMVLIWFVCMVRLSLLSPVGLIRLHAFVNHKFPGIHQHHHEHSAWENVVRRNLALVVGVPHKGPAALAGGVELEVGRVQRGAVRVHGVGATSTYAR